MMQPHSTSHSRQYLAANRIPLAERFWSKVNKGTPLDCWEWTAAKDKTGYGLFRAVSGQSMVRPHRVAYELVIGAIPEGLELDHLCNNRGCVNPYHLQPVTRLENMKRSRLWESNWQARKTHCKRGHPFDEENTYVHPVTGYRSCRSCLRAFDRQRWADGRHRGKKKSA